MAKDSTTITQNKDRRLLLFGKNKNVLIGVVAALALLLLIILAINASDQRPGRSESYKDVSGAAGLDATIDYPCPSPCEQKFNFNVYLFNEDGQQYGVFRPGKDGRVQLAAPEGEYVMLIGKRFGQTKVFPQEPLILKNGKKLVLKLRY